MTDDEAESLRKVMSRYDALQQRKRNLGRLPSEFRLQEHMEVLMSEVVEAGIAALMADIHAEIEAMSFSTKTDNAPVGPRRINATGE